MSTRLHLLLCFWICLSEFSPHGCNTLFPVSLGSRGRCQSHVYLSPRQTVKGAPSSCPSPPVTTAVCSVMGDHRTTDRCQSHWWPSLPKVSSKSLSTHATPIGVSPPWAPQGHSQALHDSPLSTPWPSSRSLVISASILVSITI